MTELVIFDMDGVLVDSEGAGIEASIKALHEYGIDAVPDDFIEFTGMGDDKFIGGAAAKHGGVYDVSMKARMYEIYVETAAEKVKVFHWSKKLIETFSARGLKVAVASASDYKKVMKNIECIGVDPSIFSAVVTGSDVTRKKPFPDIFLKAAELAGIKPECAFVCEDALSGVAAAKNAGMKCAAVTTSFPKDKLIEAGADYVTDDFSSLLDDFDKI